jgi:hypothetical protein
MIMVMINQKYWELLEEILNLFIYQEVYTHHSVLKAASPAGLIKTRHLVALLVCLGILIYLLIIPVKIIVTAAVKPALEVELIIV